MRKSFTLFFVSCILVIANCHSGDCFGQSITWQRTYQGPLIKHDYGRDICNGPGETFYFAGWTLDTHDWITVFRVNAYGDTIWSKYITGNGPIQRAYTCAMSLDSGCVLTGSWTDSIYTIKLDRNGNIVWQKFYGAGNVNLWEIKRTLDGGFIACGDGVTSTLDAYVLKIDAIGNLQWQRYYSGGAAKGYYSVEEFPGNGYLLTGYLVSDSGKVVLDKIDYDGNIIFEKKYAVMKYSYGMKIKKINSAYLIGGDHADSIPYFSVFVLKIDSVGNILNTVLFPSKTPEFFDDLESVNDNRYVFSIRSDSAATTRAKVFITNSNISVIHSRTFPAYRYASFSSILPLINGDILFGGTFNYFSYWPEHVNDFYAVRTDSLINSPPLPPISIFGSSNNNPIQYRLHNNYPNPFNSTTKIVFELPKKAHTVIRIFDILGQEVFTLMDSQLDFGTYSLIFDASHYSSGVFFCSLIINGKLMDTKKLLYLK